MSLTGVSAIFSASHNDPVRGELYGHSYRVKAWWPADPPRDATVLQVMLKTVLRSSFDHRTLAPELSRAEALSGAIKGLLDGCVAVVSGQLAGQAHGASHMTAKEGCLMINIFASAVCGGFAAHFFAVGQPTTGALEVFLAVPNALYAVWLLARLHT